MSWNRRVKTEIPDKLTTQLSQYEERIVLQGDGNVCFGTSKLYRGSRHGRSRLGRIETGTLNASSMAGSRALFLCLATGVGRRSVAASEWWFSRDTDKQDRTIYLSDIRVSLLARLCSIRPHDVGANEIQAGTMYIGRNGRSFGVRL